MKSPIPLLDVRRAVSIRLLSALTCALALGSLTGCSGERPTLASPTTDEATGPAEPAKLATLDPRAVDVATVATAVVPTVAVYDAADAAEPSWTLANPIASGGPLVFLVTQNAAEWYQVVLPVEPNGVRGWVRAADVTLARHNYRIEIHLSEFRLDVYLQGHIVRQLKIGIGTNAAPAPGVYYTTELIQSTTPDGPFGSLAYGLSGSPGSLESFDGGAGRLGIHGTADPATIGQQAADGSVRMRNADIDDLASFLPLGVPVTVVG